MPHIAPFNVLEKTTAPGVGNMTLAALAGFRRVQDTLAVADTAVFGAKAIDANGNPNGQWEYFLGTRGATDLARSTIIKSSNADAAVNFAAGDVYVAAIPWRSIITLAQWAADQTDQTTALVAAGIKESWLAGGGHAFVRVSSDQLWRRVRGIADGLPGATITYLNVGDYPISWLPEDTAATAARRIAAPEELETWPGESITFVYDGVSSRWRPVMLTAPRNDEDYQDLVDDFVMGSNETGEIGALNWSVSGTAGTHAQVAGTANQPGLIDVLTGAAATNAIRVHLGQNANSAPCLFSGAQYFEANVSIPTITTVDVRLGIGQDLSSATFGTDGVWSEFAAASSANWRCNSRGASVSNTIVDTTVPVVAGNFFLHHFYKVPSSGNWEVYLNGVRRQTFTANLPAAAVGAVPGFFVITNAASARSLRLDYARIRVGRFSGQRWT